MLLLLLGGSQGLKLLGDARVRRGWCGVLQVFQARLVALVHQHLGLREARKSLVFDRCAQAQILEEYAQLELERGNDVLAR